MAIDPHANNVYIAWASIDPNLATPIPAPNFNPNRAEVVVGTPVSNPSVPNEQILSFSGATTVNTGGNFGTQRDSHPQLVINQNLITVDFTGTLSSGSALVTGISGDTGSLFVSEPIAGTGIPAGTTIQLIDRTNGIITLSANATVNGLQSLTATSSLPGQLTVSWDDFGTGSTATPPFSNLMSNVVTAGDSYGFTNNVGGGIAPGLAPVPPATANTPVTTSFTESVDVPDPAAITGLTVTVNLIHPTVANLSIVLRAPDGSTITLFNNGALAGANLGVFGQTATNFGVNIGTIFDDNATRDIFDPTAAGMNGVAAPAIGHFRPQSGQTLDQFVRQVAASGQLNNPWTLLITDSAPEATPGNLRNFTLQFTTGMNALAPSAIATTLVPGALGNTFPTAVPSTPSGVGPGLVLGVDNTMGPDSPFQGRIYAAYVIYEMNTDPNQHVNPTTNTDVQLSYSDNGGRNWVSAGLVNDDNSTSDGHSGSSVNNAIGAAYTSGKTQFQPELAVDLATGTLVVSWRDARDDAANARVATYMTSSIDGGQDLQRPELCQSAPDRDRRDHGPDGCPGPPG